MIVATGLGEEISFIAKIGGSGKEGGGQGSVFL